MWGNIESLLRGKGLNDEEEVQKLWKDMVNFYKKYYSADRFKLVIQVKTDDNLKQVREWVEKSFGIIENKNLGEQDFSTIGRRPIGDHVGNMPYDGREHEIIAFNAF